tara:strand:- start:339 stop:635 length:297 start_codon:yes stop_codon:yes gene_type:complete
MVMNRIKEEIRFALRTREQAITLANDMVNGPGLVQKIHIGMSEEPVCWIVNEPKKPLTEERIEEIWAEFADLAGDLPCGNLAKFVSAIERAHGINSDE